MEQTLEEDQTQAFPQGWNGQPFPDKAERLVLPDGRVLEDALVWPAFCQEELGLDPDELWAALQALPHWPSDQEIPFRELGDAPHWVSGSHTALNYRGHELRRHKIWAQSDYARGLLRYGYTGWQHRISFATHAVEYVPPILQLAERLNAGLIRSRHLPHNHWIVTRYDDEHDNIGFHSDKDRDFAADSFFIVIKFGAARDFAFRLPGEGEPFFARSLQAGTAIFVRCKGSNAANDLVQHGVPPMLTLVGPSGSLVSRCIETVIPWDRVRREVEKRKVGEVSKPNDAQIVPSTPPSRVLESAVLGPRANEEAELRRQHFRVLYHWFLDEADRVRGGSDAGLRRQARAILVPALNAGACGGNETGNFFDWVAAHRTSKRTAAAVAAPPDGNDYLVQALRALLR